jgi:hypothetical protein
MVVEKDKAQGRGWRCTPGTLQVIAKIFAKEKTAIFGSLRSLASWWTVLVLGKRLDSEKTEVARCHIKRHLAARLIMKLLCRIE